MGSDRLLDVEVEVRVDGRWWPGWLDPDYWRKAPDRRRWEATSGGPPSQRISTLGSSARTSSGGCRSLRPPSTLIVDDAAAHAKWSACDNCSTVQRGQASGGPILGDLKPVEDGDVGDVGEALCRTCRLQGV
jgi:hypothetical protein